MTDDPNDQDVEQAAETVATRLAAGGALTERQALVYVYLDVLDHTRREAADRMGISMSALDDHKEAARRKVEQVRTTASILDALDEAADSLDELDKLAD